MKKLENRLFFTTKDAEEFGMGRRMLSYYVKTGVIERIGKGVYRGTKLSQIHDEKWFELATTAKLSLWMTIGLRFRMSIQKLIFLILELSA